MFGQLRTDKGLDELSQPSQRVPALHLLIGGKDAGALAAVRERLADPRLSWRVTVREGFLDMREAAELFAAADTVALPYRAGEPERRAAARLRLRAARDRLSGRRHGRGGDRRRDGLDLLAAERGGACRGARRERARAGPRSARGAGSAVASSRGERFSWPVIARRTSALYEEVLSDV